MHTERHHTDEPVENWSGNKAKHRWMKSRRRAQSNAISKSEWWQRDALHNSLVLADELCKLLRKKAGFMYYGKYWATGHESVSWDIWPLRQENVTYPCSEKCLTPHKWSQARSHARRNLLAINSRPWSCTHYQNPHEKKIACNITTLFLCFPPPQIHFKYRWWQCKEITLQYTTKTYISYY